MARNKVRRVKKVLVSSDPQLTESVVFQRYQAGLPTNSHSLSFSLSSSDGQTWYNSSLEGEDFLTLSLTLIHMSSMFLLHVYTVSKFEKGSM